MEENMGKKLKDFQNKLFKKRTGIVITGSIILLLFFCLTRTFYRQAIEYGGGYRSDLPAHIEFGITGQGFYCILYNQYTVSNYWKCNIDCSFRKHCGDSYLAAYRKADTNFKLQDRISGRMYTRAALYLFNGDIYSPYP